MNPRSAFQVVPGLVALAMLAASSVACGDDREIYLQQAPGQRVNYEAGTAWLTSGDVVKVAIAVSPKSKREAWLTVFVSNDSQEHVSVAEHHIRVKAFGGDLRLYTYDELMKKERRRQGWEKFAVGLTAGLNAYNAGQQGSYTQSGYVSGTYRSSSGGSGTVHGNVTVYGVDPVARQQAIANANQLNTQMIAQMQARQSAATGDLSARLFRSQTIAPGGAYGGDLLFALPKRSKDPQQVVVRVTTGSVSHDFYAFVDAAPTQWQLAAIASLRPRTQPDPQIAATAEPPSAPAVEVAVEVAQPVTCSRGYQQEASRCVPVQIPPNGHLTDAGDDWECDPGFTASDDSCAAAPTSVQPQFVAAAAPEVPKASSARPAPTNPHAIMAAELVASRFMEQVVDEFGMPELRKDAASNDSLRKALANEPLFRATLRSAVRRTSTYQQIVSRYAAVLENSMTDAELLATVSFASSDAGQKLLMSFMPAYAAMGDVAGPSEAEIDTVFREEFTKAFPGIDFEELAASDAPASVTTCAAGYRPDGKSCVPDPRSQRTDAY